MNRKHGHSQRPHHQRNFRADDSSYGGEMGDYDTNERIRSSRFVSDEDRRLNRQASSSERFGYPSNMNAWSGSERGRTTDRMEQSNWAPQDSDMDLSESQSYGEGSLDRSSYWGVAPSYSQLYNSRSMDSQKGHFGKGPRGYKRSDDRIQEEVCETLARNPRIDASDIEVAVSDAVVTLSGTVESRETRRAAEMAIENLSGVDDVKNEIRVKKADAFLNSSDSTFSSPTASKNTRTQSSKGSSHMS